MRSSPIISNSQKYYSDKLEFYDSFHNELEQQKNKLNDALNLLINNTLSQFHLADETDLTDKHYRQILNSLHNYNNKEFDSLLSMAGIKKVSRFSWTHSYFATNKIKALKEYLFQKPVEIMLSSIKKKCNPIEIQHDKTLVKNKKNTSNSQAKKTDINDYKSLGNKLQIDSNYIVSAMSSHKYENQNILNALYTFISGDHILSEQTLKSYLNTKINDDSLLLETIMQVAILMQETHKHKNDKNTANQLLENMFCSELSINPHTDLLGFRNQKFIKTLFSQIIENLRELCTKDNIEPEVTEKAIEEFTNNFSSLNAKINKDINNYNGVGFHKFSCEGTPIHLEIRGMDYGFPKFIAMTTQSQHYFSDGGDSFWIDPKSNDYNLVKSGMNAI